MSSNIEDIANGVVRYYGAQKGVVTNVTDDEGIHRVKAKIGGIIDETDWMYPLTAGGGSKQRGGHIAPVVGSDVVVWFHNGDPHGDAWYMCGSWGVPDAGTELPVDIQADKSNAALISTLQLGSLSFSVDERPGKRKFEIRDDETQDHVLWDLENKTLEIIMTTGIIVKAIGQLSLKGAQTVIHKRFVLPNGKTV